MKSCRNLYVHFPFCRSKCSYCALFSRAGTTESERKKYADILRREIDALDGGFATVYFGGGSPALCELKGILKILSPKLDGDCEFTVELHPKDVAAELLEELKGWGVNRISMGLQSLSDATLEDMDRGYTFAEAEAAFAAVKSAFDNAGVDLIVGYPGDDWPEDRFERLLGWGLRHVSVYTLQLEKNSRLCARKTLAVEDDDSTMDKLLKISSRLSQAGFRRYEISNYAEEGFECRHNLAVWRGEDYIGLGAGAYGREGLVRTQNRGLPPEGFMGKKPEKETVTRQFDLKERGLFRLRTAEGIAHGQFPEWEETLKRFVELGCAKSDHKGYRLTERGWEICDSILASLI